MGKSFSAILIILVFLLLLVPFSHAAILRGSVYDADLNKVDNAIIEVDSEPVQRVLSANGSYSFELAPGQYTLKAYEKSGNYIISSSEDNVSIRQEGAFVFDIFLFPSLDEDVLSDISDINVEDVDYGLKQSLPFYIFIIIILIAVAAIIIFVVMQYRKIAPEKKEEAKEEKAKDKEKTSPESKEKPEKPEEHLPGSDLDEVILIITKEGGRMTQKDLRKRIPYSEAKISLMITELEHKGKVERIKKGRGNIIVLKQN